jgi:hypothetical protein
MLAFADAYVPDNNTIAPKTFKTTTPKRRVAAKGETTNSSKIEISRTRCRRGFFSRGSMGFERK